MERNAKWTESLYSGLESFSEVGPFVPFQTDRQGTVLREVAPASIALPLPDHPSETLPLRVALIRDRRRSVPVPPAPDEDGSLPRWDADLPRDSRSWWHDDWQATPAPAAATAPKLIPIVTTAQEIDATELAQTYIHRWPAQENVIKDFLLPLGLDTNHGFAKTPVVNSEAAKKQTALEKRLANVQRWAKAARERSHKAGALYKKRCQLTKERADALYRGLEQRQRELEREGVTPWKQRDLIKDLKAAADAEIAQYQARQWKAYDTHHQEYDKCER